MINLTKDIPEEGNELESIIDSLNSNPTISDEERFDFLENTCGLAACYGNHDEFKKEMIFIYIPEKTSGYDH